MSPLARQIRGQTFLKTDCSGPELFVRTPIAEREEAHWNLRFPGMARNVDGKSASLDERRGNFGGVETIPGLFLPG